jgi:hypothetical protein
MRAAQISMIMSRHPLSRSPFHRSAARQFRLGLAAILALPAGAATVARHSRFEKTFESAADYANPVQEAALTVTFSGPGGLTLKAPGFWDGGKTWRVRFSPPAEGQWNYLTACSDAANAGLHQQRGTFTAGPPAGQGRFDRHGPVRVAHDGRSLEHADGAPFFWLADTGWNAALLATDDEWAAYVKERARQKFTAIQFVTTQWRASPDGDAHKQPAFTGKEKISVHPAFFQRLDARVDALHQAGLVASPVQLWAIGGGSGPQNPGYFLPEDQAILLARYMAARWGDRAVVWMLGGDGDYRGDKAARWQRIGRAVFGDIAHGPVVMHPQGMQWLWKEFIEEKWVGFIGYQSGHGDDDKTLRWIFEGPATEDWMKLPHKPFINLEPPYENHLGYQSKKPHTPESVRRAMYWSLLSHPTAGVTYGGHGVWGWDDGTKAPTDHAGTGVPLPWSKALKMPAAEQMAHLSDIFTGIDFHRLRPAPSIIVNNPGKDAPARHVAAAKSDQRDLCVIYVPEDRTVEVKLDGMPASPNITWVSPRTGERHPAVGVVTASTCQFPTPAEGDWVLLMTPQTDKPKDAGEAPPKP